MKKCSCGATIDESEHGREWFGASCRNCYNKKKRRCQFKNGYNVPKDGHWLCSCGRPHPNKHLFCWECGHPKTVNSDQALLSSLSHS